MGTRSLTHIYDNKNLLVTIYRQMDGYPTGMGLDLYNFLKDVIIVNGFSFDNTRKIANGFGCLAAQLIKELKDGVGSVYIYPPNSKGCGEAYTYKIFSDSNNQIRLACHYCDGTKLFDEKVSDLNEAYFKRLE